MKNVKYILFIMIVFASTFIGCSSKRDPGRTYMPDMAYSRAYEAYDQHNLKQGGINYIQYPVEGTVRRGDLFALTLPSDSTGYNKSAALKNPLAVLDTFQMLEAKRLYSINCAICHGEKLDAQGPLAGKVGGIANLTVEQYVNQPEGQMYHVVTYGKGNMGSYAAQLDRKQRWMVVQYVKSEQMKGGAGNGTTTGSDTTANK